MSVLSDILQKIVQLVEGTDATPDFTVPVGTFDVVGDDHDWEQATADDNPQPVYIEPGDWFVPDAAPSDLSGNYKWRGYRFSMWVGYSFTPDDGPIDRVVRMADDEQVLTECLEDPITWATVLNWCNTDITPSFQPVTNAAGVVVLLYLFLDISLTYRELRS